MKKLSIALCILSTFICCDTFAANCEKQDAYTAETVTDYLDSWHNVYLFFKQFRHCYDAAIAEGAERKIHKLWVEHWAALPEMIALTNKDSGFKTFIWKRIDDETMAQEDLSQLKTLARKECPSVAKEFCQQIIKAR